MPDRPPPAPDAAPPPGPAAPSRRFLPLALGALLVVLTILAYMRVGEGGFINLDDDAYVEHQPLVNGGLRFPALVWAWTGTHSNNWHPLTTLSHQLDCEWFGLRPAPMHWINLGWHVLNSLLVFLVWRSLSGALWRPAVVAACFALHPLHVESVAWISERKDVLCGFFWLLCLWSYAAYVRRPGTARYVVVLTLAGCALLSKPMAVTLPCTLLLLDFWPLRRWPDRPWRALVWEKAPLFALVGLHSLLTYSVQHATGAGRFGATLEFWPRVANALVSYVRYIGKTLWPETLSPLYFHPGTWPGLTVAGAATLLLAFTALAWLQRRARPWLLFGWLWFLGTLVPVIGLVQVGEQAMADRYMYLPILGLFTLAVWSGGAVLEARPRWRRPAFVVSGALLALMAILTARQVPVWRDSVTLFRHSIAVGEDNPAIRYLLALALQAAGRPEAEVAAEYRRALALQPGYFNAHTQLAALALAGQRFDEARALIEESIRHAPREASLRVNLGAFWLRAGRPDEAVPHFEHALRLDPAAVRAHLELGQVRVAQHRLADALPHYAARARLDRWNPDALAEYGTLLLQVRRLDEARAHLARALWLRPDLPLARTSLATVEKLLRERG